MKIYFRWYVLFLVAITLTATGAGCQSTGSSAGLETAPAPTPQETLSVEGSPAESVPYPAPEEAQSADEVHPADEIHPTDEAPAGNKLAPTVEFSLLTAVGGGRILYVGIGGEIDGVTNPDLNVKTGDVVRIFLTNGDHMQHDLFLPDFDAKTPPVIANGDRAEVVFVVKDKPAGEYAYFCTFPGHRQAGQEGRLVVTAP